jgi:hypothetical protein
MLFLNSFNPLQEFLSRLFVRQLGVKKLKSFELAPDDMAFSSEHYLSRTAVDSVRDLFHNFLETSGWVESQNHSASYFKGRLIPWLTYPFLFELSSWQLSKVKVLEFGSGASSIYFSRNAESVVTYEFDSTYAELVMHPILPRYPNLTLHTVNEAAFLNLLETKSENFSSLISEIEKSQIILIDGGPRNEIARFIALKALQDAVIVFDNTDLEDWSLGRKLLKESGFIEIPYHGLGNLNPYSWTTSLFLRNLETLELLRGKP